MGLFIPLSEEFNPEDLLFSVRPLFKGSIYNLDRNEFITFQFNPKSFEFKKKLDWAENNWIGQVNGSDLQYISTGPYEFELDLLYLTDPGAPNVGVIGDQVVPITPGFAVDFNVVIATINNWTQPMAATGRPSKIQVVIGEQNFVGVLKTFGIKITEYFDDLTPREGLLSIEFREWNV